MKVSIAEIKKNTDRKRHGLEMRFPNPLDPARSEIIQQNNWRFNPNKETEDPCWWCYFNADSERFAQKFIAAYNRRFHPESQALVTGVIDSHQSQETPPCQTQKAVTPSLTRF